MDNKYKGTKTEKNLEAAFAGESQVAVFAARCAFEGL